MSTATELAQKDRRTAAFAAGLIRRTRGRGVTDRTALYRVATATYEELLDAALTGEQAACARGLGWAGVMEAIRGDELLPAAVSEAGHPCHDPGLAALGWGAGQDGVYTRTADAAGRLAAAGLFEDRCGWQRPVAEVTAQIACPHCPAQIRRTGWRFRVAHTDACPSWRRYQRKLPGYTALPSGVLVRAGQEPPPGTTALLPSSGGTVPCGTSVTHRGPYRTTGKRDQREAAR
jgi:hypothetical protein